MTIIGMKKSAAMSTGKNSVINMNIFFRTEERYSRLKTANIFRMHKSVSEGIVSRVPNTPWKGHSVTVVAEKQGTG